ncbi:MAG: metallophosphoesterase [Candidatus Bathyarchaeota archaeon]
MFFDYSVWWFVSLLVGLISDTHDNISAINEAVKVFNGKGVRLVLHAGDYNSPFTAKLFKKLNCNLIGVFGNIDGEREMLQSRYSKINAEIRGNFAEVEAGGLKIALLHGIHEPIINALAKCGEYGVVVHGHTHVQRNQKVRETLVVNPGEACGYLTGKKTVAILDTMLKVEFIEF